MHHCCSYIFLSQNVGHEKVCPIAFGENKLEPRPKRTAPNNLLQGKREYPLIPFFAHIWKTKTFYNYRYHASVEYYSTLCNIAWLQSSDLIVDL